LELYTVKTKSRTYRQPINRLVKWLVVIVNESSKSSQWKPTRTGHFNIIQT